MPSPKRAFCILLALCLLAFICAFASLSLGTLSLSPWEIARILLGEETANAPVIWVLRLPRILLGFACGGLLALSGVLLQVLLRNPLADPYVLGVSGGAGVGAMSALFFGLGSAFIGPFAFLGALLVMSLVFGLSRGDGTWSQSRLLLTGVMLASFCGAIIALLLSIAPEKALRGMLFWLMGDLSYANDTFWPLLSLFLLTVFATGFARELNLLARGHLFAATLGVSVPLLRWLIYLTASFAAALAVKEVGTIGFVGFVVPHTMRLFLGTDHRLLLPASVLAGGSLLIMADTLSRILIAPQVLPVGVLTAFIGVPLFLFLLAKDRARGSL